MDAPEDCDLVFGNGINEKVWKPTQDRTPQLAAHYLELIRVAADRLNHIL